MRLLNKLITGLFILLTFAISAHAAFLWDASNDTASLSDNTALTFPNSDWTVAGWVKFTSRAGTTSRRIWNWGNQELQVGDASSGSFSDDIVWNLGAFSVESTSEPFDSNTSWTHVTVQRSGTTVTIYINGSSVASNTGISAGSDESASWIFGNRGDGARPLNGNLASWGKWSRALSSAEIAGLVAGYSPVCFMNSLDWHTPMIADYNEIKASIAFTNGASTAATTVSSHPGIVLCE